MRSDTSHSFWRRHPVRALILLAVGVPVAIGAIVPLAFTFLVIVLFAAPLLLLPAVAIFVASGLRSEQRGSLRDEEEKQPAPLGLGGHAPSAA